MSFYDYQCIGEALAGDVRAEAKRRRSTGGPDVYRTLGKTFDVTRWATYKWAERAAEHRWRPEEIEAVILETGGSRTLAFLRRLAGRADRYADGVTVECVFGEVADVVEAAGSLNSSVAHAVKDGVIDSRERVALLEGLSRLEREIVEARVAIEEVGRDG